MAALYEALLPAPEYWDRRTCSSFEDWKEAVAASTVVYVGNLNFSTTEEELYEVRVCCGRRLFRFLSLVASLFQGGAASCE